MQVLAMLRSAASEMAKVITFGAKIQGEARARIITSLQDICDRCESAYSKVLERLLPVKSAFSDRQQLVLALRRFASDPVTREAFKPEKLCGSIDRLLDDMQNNLNAMKYSLDVTRIRSVKDSLHLIGNYDTAIRQQYDQFTRELDRLATDLEKANDEEAAQLLEYLRKVIQDFQDELSVTIQTVRNVKRDIVRS